MVFIGVSYKINPMSFNDDSSYYDILDITSDSSAQEVREAYIRSKATFHRDSAAMYSILSKEDREDALRKIEEAYQVLSHPEKRKEYDKSHGVLFEPPPHSPVDFPDNVVSIDRVPPMENLPDGDQLLIPPKTDFELMASSTAPSSNPSHSPPPYPAIPPAPLSSPQVHVLHPSLKHKSEENLTHAIDVETEWSGTFLKKIRTAQKLSIEEMAGLTKITKSYIVAIEEENFLKLPAPVYIRGFVSQIAKVLKLPHERVATAYLSRYHSSASR